MKPIRSVYNWGTFYGVRCWSRRLESWVWLDGKKMNGTHINDALLFCRLSTAERYAKKHHAEAVRVAQTLHGRAVIQSERTAA